MADHTGKRSAEGCEACRRCLDRGGYQWFLGTDDRLHNHLPEDGGRRPRRHADIWSPQPVNATRTVTFSRASLARPAAKATSVAPDGFALTPEEVRLADQFGLSHQDVRVQKLKDANAELQGQIDAIEFIKEWNRKEGQNG